MQNNYYNIYIYIIYNTLYVRYVTVVTSASPLPQGGGGGISPTPSPLKIFSLPRSILQVILIKKNNDAKGKLRVL